MSTPTVISGGQVVTPAGVVTADVVLAGETLAGVVLPGTVSGDAIDARGCYVIPGGVDPHVHLLSDVPAADQALLGGTTTALSFTWPQPGEAPVAAFERARDRLLPSTSLDVGLHAAMWSPDAVTAQDVAGLHTRGVCGLKLYLAYPELGMMASDAVVYRVMRWGREHALPVQVHCENGDLIAALTEEALAAGRTGVHEFFATRPVVAEQESVHRILCLAEFTGAGVYLVHLSTAGALEHVRAARRRGVAVWAEACTSGLMLDDSVIQTEDPRRFMAAPPPRPRAHVEAVWEAVADGTLDSLGSDHHERLYSPPEAPDFTGLGYSIRGIRVRLPMLLGEGLRRGIPIERLVGLLCTGPARAFGLRSKGALHPGADADVAIWDPDASWTIGEDYPTWSGMTVPGAVRTVVRRGEVVVSDGELLDTRSPGRHLRREGPGLVSA
ncbi:MAG: dihydroorotase [Solirubrobacteraceae bacterium]